MKLTDNQIMAIRDGTEGVTPGPWAWGKRWYSGYQIGTLTGATPVLDLGGAGVSVIAAAHIARCDPDTIRALATEVLESRAALAAKDAEIERLTKERDAADAALPLIRGAVVEECADIAHEYWEAVVSYHGHVPTDPIEAMTKAAQEIEVAIGWLTAKPRKKD